MKVERETTVTLTMNGKEEELMIKILAYALGGRTSLVLNGEENARLNNMLIDMKD